MLSFLKEYGLIIVSGVLLMILKMPESKGALLSPLR